MVKLELPHVNVLTKMDICPDRAAVEELLQPDGRQLAGRLAAATGPRFARLNAAVASLLDEFSLVSAPSCFGRICCVKAGPWAWHCLWQEESHANAFQNDYGGRRTYLA